MKPTSATKPKKVAKSKKSASKENGKEKSKGRASKWSPKAKITLLVKENPKRAGSGGAKRFAKYKSGMTVEAALKAGLTAADLRWDKAHDFIAIKN